MSFAPSCRQCLVPGLGIHAVFLARIIRCRINLNLDCMGIHVVLSSRATRVIQCRSRLDRLSLICNNAGMNKSHASELIEGARYPSRNNVKQGDSKTSCSRLAMSTSAYAADAAAAAAAATASAAAVVAAIALGTVLFHLL